MGLFDTVYLSKEVIADWMLRCQKCGNVPDAKVAWQSKALESCMTISVLSRLFQIMGPPLNVAVGILCNFPRWLRGT